MRGSPVPRGLDAEQMRNAAIIAQVGRQVGASARDIKIALITAMQESGLRNLDYGDRDSLGLFQQRPSMSWGSADQVTDPRYAARAFFLGAGTNPGLLDLDNRRNMSMTEAAQAVQRSAYPDAYAQHIDLVNQIWPSVERGSGREPVTVDGGRYRVDGGYAGGETFIPGLDPEREEDRDLTGFAGALLAAPYNPLLASPAQNGTGATEDPDYISFTSPLRPLPDDEFSLATGAGYGRGAGNGWRKAVVEKAREYLGTPYVWGGTDPATGFDCSGFLQYVYGKLGMDLPRISYQQATAGKRVGLGALKPGDLVAWDNSTRNSGADHIAIYMGNGKIIEAPRPGLGVRIRELGQDEDAWGVRLNF